jgi:hypothetical protein
VSYYRQVDNHPPLFAKPGSEYIPLSIQPRLASWMVAGHPDQVRLEEFLTHAYELVQHRLEQVPDPLVLGFDVGLQESTRRLESNDLDNYLFPLAKRLSERSGREFASVWGSKRHASASSICVAQVRPTTSRPPAECSFTVRTNTSAQSTAYKQQIHDQFVGAVELGEGAVSMQLSFSVGPRRNWLNLWKATIDALDPILGQTIPQHPWHPRDGRIVELGLHHRLEPTLKNDVLISISATAAT